MDSQTNLYHFEEKLVEKFSWTNYNKSQTSEKRLFIKLLNDITDTLEKREKQKIFCMLMKTYNNISSRRLISDLAMAKQGKLIEHVPHFNSVLNYFNSKSLRPILKYLIELSAIPLAQLERRFAIDSSGISTHQNEVWNSVRSKYNEHKKYKKIHCVYGVLTNVVVSCKVTEGNGADSPRFMELLRRAADNFTVEEISADKAYSSRENLAFASSIGSIPFIPFKSNARPRAGGKSIWHTMYYYFKEHSEDFLKHYHKRSNAETGFYMIKTKFGEFVRCKNDIAQENEAYCKILAHNICCLIQEMFLSKIEVNFLEVAQRFVAQ